MIQECPICRSERNVCFPAEILAKYKINYLSCKKCGLLQTETPYWLEEAYGSAIASTDTGLLMRNLSLSKKLACTLFFFFNKEDKYKDVGGGYGVLTRLMRDIGFDFYWFDPYCENLFAKQFNAANTNKPFSAITAFEVMEHIYDPIEFIKASIQEAGTSTIIFSTELFKGSPPEPSSWEYYSLTTGQHISFYQRKTLDFLAKELSLNVYSYKNFHILTDKSIKFQAFCFFIVNLSKFIFPLVKLSMQSKTLSDREKIILNQL